MRPRLGKTTNRPVGGETPAEPVSERVTLGLVVSLAGGHMDAFSYLLHGGVFANGQTGNYVLLVLSLAAGDIRGVVRYLIPIGAFLAAIVMARHVTDALCGGDRFRAQHWVADFEALGFALLSLLSGGLTDLFANSVVSFLAAMTFQTFRQFGTKSAYAGVFITGNLRSLGNSLYEGFARGNAHERHRAFRYLAIVMAFGTGVLLGRYMVELLGHSSCLVISALFLMSHRFVVR